MTKAEVAALLRVTPRTVENHALRGNLPYLKVGRSIRFERCAILAWMGKPMPQETDLPTGEDDDAG